MSVGQNTEKMDKVTILLPHDTVSKIDHMAQKALLGSRGRVIQSLIDSIWESQVDIKLVQSAIQTYLGQTPENQLKTVNATGFLFSLFFPLSNILRRIDTYLGVLPSNVTPNIPLRPAGEGPTANAKG